MIPEQLQKKGFKFILLDGKRPVEKEWQKTNNYEYDNPRLLHHLEHRGNYGVLCGTGNLIVIDFDKQEIQDEIVPKLPQTLTVKTGRGLMHKYFIVDEPENIKILDPEKETLIDVQGTGKQVVGSGSIHPETHQAYEVIDNSPIAETTIAEIKATLSKYIPKKEIPKTYNPTGEKDPTLETIKIRFPVSQALQDLGISLSPSDTNCNCPLHSSKQGKCLSYDDVQGLWHCFHCNKGGDVFSLYMETKGFDFPTTKKFLMEKAGLLNQEVTQEQEVPKECLDILNNPELLNLLCNEVQKTVVGEIEAIKTILVCANGRNVVNHNIASYNLLVNSDSGSGKDHVVSHALDVLPEKEYVKKTRITPNVFTYWHNSKFEPEWSWNKKVFYGEDISNSVLNSDVFKVMCSSGSNATVLIKQKAIDIEIKGKPVMILTTAKTTPSEEQLRRCVIINLNETVDQTKAIMQRVAEAEAQGTVIEPSPEIRKAISHLKRVKVKVPFAQKLIEFFPTSHLIIRTHFPRFLDIIKASASLHQYQREKENNTLIANGQDYDIAREVLLKMTSNAYMIPLTQEQRKILKVFEDFHTGKKIIKKRVCGNCGLICETKECPKCYDSENGERVRTDEYTLQEFCISDLEPYMNFFTGTDRWLRKLLAILTSYGFLEKNTQKRANSDKPFTVYTYKNLVSINIPKWQEIP